MARYLVTGGAGFIGSSIAAALLNRGDQVTILDNLSSGREENLDRLRGNVDVIRGDIRNDADLERACRGTRGVFHQAAVASVERSVVDPVTCDDVNVHGTVRLLDTARRAGIEHFVFAASAAAYGNAEADVQREDATPDPISPYAVTKVAGEHYVRIFARLYRMKTLSLRYFNVFGPFQDPNSDYAAAIPIFIRTLLAAVPPRIFGDGEQTRDFCYIDDVVAANLAAMTCPNASGQVVNIGGGRGTSIRELVETLNHITQANLAPIHEAPRAGDVRHSLASIDRARELLSYSPTVSLREGLERTVAHFRRGA